MSVLRPIDVAKRWQCSERHVRNVLSTDPEPGQLRGFKAGGKLWRTRSEWVEEYEQCQTGDLDGTGESSAPSGDQEQADDGIRYLTIAKRLNACSTD